MTGEEKMTAANAKFLAESKHETPPTPAQVMAEVASSVTHLKERNP